MKKSETEIFYPATVKQWRKWLEKNHLSKQSVWLVFYTKSSGKKTLSWSEAVDVALCFGWIDSKKIKIDEETAHQFFSRRKPKSTWSKINKQKIEKLIESGLLAEASYQSVATAKQNGSWTILDEVEELIVPKDLKSAFKKRPGAETFFLSQGKSVRKMILQWLILARRSETRHNRITEVAESAQQQLKPKHLR